MQSAHGRAAGQAYFISDGAPVNNFQFLRGISNALGLRFPTVAVPVWTMIMLAWCIEIVWQVLSAAGIEFNPLITRAEVLKVGVTHYFSTAKAKAELGYDPPVSPSEGQQRLVEDIVRKEERLNALLQAQRTVKSSTNKGFPRVQRPHVVWCVAVLSGMALLALCALGPTPLPGMLEHVRSFSILIFQSQQGLQILFEAAVMVHAGEATYAYVVASDCDQKNALGWTFQTFLLGYPSLRLLLKRRAKRKSAEFHQ